MTRRFSSLASFGRFVNQRTAVMVPIGKLMIGASARILYDKTRGMYGDRSLADLSPATQADRVAKGYSPNDPLLRDGALLRDSVEMEVGETFAAVGTPEPIAKYHEFGYVNARTGRPVPPRPVFKIALDESVAPIMRMVEANVGAQLGFGIVDEQEPMLPGIGPEITASTSAAE